jgi:molybdenum cofactor cytidylyltransferase
MTGSGAASISVAFGHTMACMAARAAGIILAAGLSSRFGSNKLLAHVRGRPILQRVLDVAAAARLRPVVVVTGPDGAAPYAALAWRDELVVMNRRPEDGLSGSLQLGLTTLASSDAQRVMVLLADQPLLSRAQIGVILAAPMDQARPIVVPRYGGRQGNPVLLDRPVWHVAAELSGDRGMSQVFKSRPDLVRYVDVPGVNPDVDTPDDLAELISGEG